MLYMFIYRAPERPGPPDPVVDRNLRALIQRKIEAGTFVSTGGLGATADGGRVEQSEDGEVTVIDGPFAEAKEVVAGFAIFDLPSKEVAAAEAKEFLEIMGGAGSSEYRPLYMGDSAEDSAAA